MHWLTDPIFKHYADFSGRASRKAFWMFQLGIVFVGVLSIILLSFIAHIFDLENQNEYVYELVFVPLVVLILFMLIPSIAITVRRLHDTGRSGWWYFITFLPYVGGAFLLVFGCLQSQKGVNRYGPNPYDIEAELPITISPTVFSDKISN